MYSKGLAELAFSDNPFSAMSRVLTIIFSCDRKGVFTLVSDFTLSFCSGSGRRIKILLELYILLSSGLRLISTENRPEGIKHTSYFHQFQQFLIQEAILVAFGL